MGTPRCRVCNRPLTHPKHAAAGIGPTCAAKLGLTFAPKARKAREPRVKPMRRTQPATAMPLPFEEEAQP